IPSKAKYGRETDSEQVPRGKDEKDFEKRVKECLKLSGGKRMGAGDAPRSDVERSKAGPPIGSGCGSTRIAAAAQAQVFETPAEMPSLRSWKAARAVSACFGTSVLLASASGLPIRPVFKHGPRSLTCVRVNGRVNP